MNVDTGELIRLRQHQSASGDYVIVPATLKPAANKKLAGEDNAVVSLSSGGKLSKWSRKKRKERRKLVKVSKVGNRNK
jgi:hypothetical protein